MTSRRRFLTGSGSVGLAALSGCLLGDGGDDGQSFSGTPDPVPLGESFTYGGLEMTATEYRTTKSGEDNRGKQVADEGDIYLLVHLRVENVSGSRISYPERDGDVRVLYQGEQVTDGLAWGKLVVDGEKLPLYRVDMDEKDADIRAPPGTVVSGWTIFVLPEGFDESETLVGMTYTDERAENLEFKWRLAE